VVHYRDSGEVLRLNWWCPRWNAQSVTISGNVAESDQGIDVGSI
jgi:hypothetical protein